VDWLAPVGDIFGFTLPFLDSVPAVRAIIGFVLVFFLPGFAWTLVFFRQLDLVARIALSVALSIAVVTLSILALNVLFGVRITGLNSLVIIAVVTLIPIGIRYLRRSGPRG
jgi:uncharacterized membrane protein